jgi:integrase
MPGIRRSNPMKLPPRVYHRGNAFYYVTAAGKWVQLGKEWDLAARVKWAELAGETMPSGTVIELINEYRKRVLPTKAVRTRADNEIELDRLGQVFGRMAIGDLRLRHAAGYLEARAAKVRGNREIALFSHAIRWGMNVGLVNVERHPFEGIIYNKERPRERLVSDGELERFLGYCRGAHPIVGALVRLLYLTAQRRVDLLSLRVNAIEPEGLRITQSKTGARLLIEWSRELRAAVASAQAVHAEALAKRKLSPLTLICTREGQPYTDAGIKAMFNRAMISALSTEAGPPVLAERFRMQDMRPKAVSDVGGGQRGKELAGHRTQATTDRIYDRVTFRKVKPTR